MSVNPVKILSESLIKEFLKRNGYIDTLNEFNKECPETELHPSSTSELVKSLRLGKLFNENKNLEKDKRLQSNLEIMTNFFILPQLKELEILNAPAINDNNELPKVENTQPVEGEFKTPDGKIFKTRDEWRRYMFKTFYSYDSRTDETLRKNNGDIDGQAFDICNIHNCTIELLDWSASINIDDVYNSTLVIGPVSDSLFIRNIHDTTMYVVCRQLRTRDCSNCNIYLFCQTDPIIETSTNMLFSPYMCPYPHLKKVFFRIF